MNFRKERILRDIDLALEELYKWHVDAEQEFDYHCPGCNTCVVVIPELKRLYDIVVAERADK